MDDPVFNKSPQPGQPPTPNTGQDATATLLNSINTRLERTEAQAQQLSAANSQLTEHLNTLVGVIQQLQTQKATPAPSHDPNDDPVSALTRDPDSYIQARAKAVLDETLNGQTAINSKLVDTLHANILRDREQDLTSRYGPEAWQGIIKPNLDKLVAQTRTTNRLGLADETLIDAFINKIKGENLEALVDAKTKADASRADAEVKSRESIMSAIRNELPPVGRLRRTTGGDKLDPKDIPGLDVMRQELAQAGVKTDLDAFMKVHTAGTNDIETILARLHEGDAKPAGAN